MQQLGFSASKQLAQIIFDELDTDASYRINFTEFNKWLTHRAGAATWKLARTKMMAVIFIQSVTRRRAAIHERRLLEARHQPSKEA